MLKKAASDPRLTCHCRHRAAGTEHTTGVPRSIFCHRCHVGAGPADIVAVRGLTHRSAVAAIMTFFSVPCFANIAVIQHKHCGMFDGLEKRHTFAVAVAPLTPQRQQHNQGRSFVETNAVKSFHAHATFFRFNRRHIFYDSQQKQHMPKRVANATQMTPAGRHSATHHYRHNHFFYTKHFKSRYGQIRA